MAEGRISRRSFVKGAAGGVAGLSLVSAGPAIGELGANDKIVVGCIGTGGMGMAHLRSLAKMKDVTIAAVCDVDQGRCEAAAKEAGTSPKMFKDFRQVLDMKEIDAVLIATPGHWHIIPAIAACQAGKDVYVEKPLGHNIREGRAFVEAARKHDRITQVGMQQRSAAHWANAVRRIRAGELGKISMVHAWNAWDPKEMFSNIGFAEDSDPPPGVDYDLWLGPA
ncbi:MAG TPA: Gfo/Idh/MocA family oxidoreductase, partial [Phycisphaerae bacterium]|nr:Gfo/Idh/MocA family oxidoreductase [Phycisphaerae bacterium]